MKPGVVAVDGARGAGVSTLARHVANAMAGRVVDLAELDGELSRGFAAPEVSYAGFAFAELAARGHVAAAPLPVLDRTPLAGLVRARCVPCPGAGKLARRARRDGAVSLIGRYLDRLRAARGVLVVLLCDSYVASGRIRADLDRTLHRRVDRAWREFVLPRPGVHVYETDGLRPAELVIRVLDALRQAGEGS